jgi:hypothetical protein
MSVIKKENPVQYENSRVPTQTELYLSICFSIMYNILMSSVKKEKICAAI